MKFQTDQSDLFSMTSQIGKMAAALIKQFYCKCSSLAETLTYLEPSWLACNQDNDTVHNLQLCNDILVGGDEEEFAKFTASAKRSLQVNSSLEELVTRVVQVGGNVIELMKNSCYICV